MDKLPWMLLLLMTLNFSITMGQMQYTSEDIRRIVVNYAMRFWTFPKDHDQYAVLILLPVNKNLQLEPVPGRLNAKTNEYSQYNEELFIGDVLTGINYAAARSSANGGLNTETQILDQLPTMLAKYRKKFVMEPAAILLYTRETPCPACTTAISFARNNHFRNGQFVVAYTINIANSYRSPIINCENRNFLRGLDAPVLCVKEQYNGQNQCLEEDCNTMCIEHNFLYGQYAQSNFHPNPSKDITKIIDRTNPI